VYAAPDDDAASEYKVLADELYHPEKLLPVIVATSAALVAAALVVGM
jgi:hypothetical protein